MSAIGNLVKGPARDALDKLQKNAPAQIDATAAQAGTAIVGTVAKASELFTRLYSQATAGIAAWLPSTKPFLLAQVAKGVTAAKAYVGKL
jgi:hypothetical protein